MGSGEMVEIKEGFVLWRHFGDPPESERPPADAAEEKAATGIWPSSFTTGRRLTMGENMRSCQLFEQKKHSPDGSQSGSTSDRESKVEAPGETQWGGGAFAVESSEEGKNEDFTSRFHSLLP